MPKSKVALVLYAVAAMMLLFSLHGLVWAATYSDHQGHLFEALDREIPGIGLAAFVFGVGSAVQILSDIRQLLLNRERTDA